MMEVGAGNGSTLFPLMALNPLSHFFAFDFSAEAIAVINVCAFVLKGKSLREIVRREPRPSTYGLTLVVTEPRRAGSNTVQHICLRRLE